MSTIQGIGTLGGYSDISSLGARSRSAFREEALFSLPKANAQEPATRQREINDQSFQAAQAIDEGFARLRLGLQDAGNGMVSGSVVGSSLAESLADSGSVAREEFRKYMEMTPAEKMRDSILKELGLTEEELDAMPPEQQSAIEEKIVQRIKERSQVAISGGSESQMSNPWQTQRMPGQNALGSGDSAQFSQFV
ncbi:hypothetical protein [Pseudomonas sp. S9]|uniref:hypothetical protein n=1 Tax=Pseudomonas sp. S9 TaxID=686578 RepID=UPI00025567AB|nr:hypothetical protein [Pseudomonas sp. S9]